MKELELYEIKRLQFSILEAFSDYCKSNGLTFYLAYGTLIGAIRHKGYIPWDDDIDVIMPRPDYLKFIKNFTHERYKVFCPENNTDCPFVYGKLYDSLTHLDELTACKYNIGLNIDIFVLDGIPSDPQEARKHIRDCSFWINIMEVKKMGFTKGRSLLRNVELALLKTLCSVVPYNVARDKVRLLNQKFALAESDYCSDLSYTGALHMKKEVFDMAEGEFERKIFPIPAGYDTWLTLQYGDYMKLPPEEKRATHHDYKAYIK